jgi:hypothetical protein
MPVNVIFAFFVKESASSDKKLLGMFTNLKNGIRKVNNLYDNDITSGDLMDFELKGVLDFDGMEITYEEVKINEIIE